MKILTGQPTRLVDDEPRTSRHLDAPWHDDVGRHTILESSQSTRLQRGQTCQRAAWPGAQDGSPPQLAITEPSLSCQSIRRMKTAASD